MKKYGRVQKRISGVLTVILAVLMLSGLCTVGSAKEKDSSNVTLGEKESLLQTEAKNGAEKEGYCINEQSAFKIGRKDVPKEFLDDDETTFKEISGSPELKITSTEDIGGLYIKFNRIPEEYEVIAGEYTYKGGTFEFLHDYVEIPNGNVRSLTVAFKGEISICDIYLLSKGETPSFVQKWRPAEGYADVMLLISHSDDDQLFFAGSIPDAVARGAEMQVCYFTRHWTVESEDYTRYHELLNGLWVCGLDRYPITGAIPDYWTNNEELAMFRYESDGIVYDDMVRLKVTLIRRYRPQVILGHDLNGEYGHGTHILDSRSTRDAVLAAADALSYPASAEVYGVWDTPKTYIHLYEKNKIVFDIDKPLPYFNGKTAFQISQEAFLCHLSQRSTRYTEWLLGSEGAPVTDSSQFPMYSPRYYGLWRTLVGEDTEATDFYQNIVLYKDREDNDWDQKSESTKKAEADFMKKERAEQQEYLHVLEMMKRTAAIGLVLFLSMTHFRRKSIKEREKIRVPKFKFLPRTPK